MQKGKKVKLTQPPSFKEPITIKTIEKFIKSRRTQQGLNTHAMQYFSSHPKQNRK